MRGRNATMNEVFQVVKSGAVGKRKTLAELKREQQRRAKPSTSSQSQSASFRLLSSEGGFGQENCSQGNPTPSCDFEDDGLSIGDGSAPSQSMQPFFLGDIKRVQSSRNDAAAKKPPRSRLEQSQSCSFRTIGDVANEARQLAEPERKPLHVLNGINRMLAKSPLKVKPKEATKVAAIGQAVFGERPRRDGDQIRCGDGLPPMDWSIKTSARFVSPAPFDWCLTADAQAECSSVRSSAANDRPCLDSQASTSGRSASDGAAFRAALTSWSHPESALPPSILQAVQTWLERPAGQDAHFWTQREARWQESLRSLYLMLRTGMCPVFYCRFPQYVAMFMGPGIAGHKEQECCAYVTRSTGGMRDLLKEQGLDFVMPLYRQDKTFSEETDRQFEELAKENPAKVRHEDPMAAIDGKPQSLLFFHGADAVHGLYDTLLNHRLLFPSSTLTDAPLLMSPVPFANATLKAPMVITKKMQQADGSVGHSLELAEAVCPPWIISRVCEALKHSDTKSVDASFVTDPFSHCLNVLPSASGVGDTRQASRSALSSTAHKIRGCLDEQEEVRWRRAYDLGIGVVRQLRYRNGDFVATLKCSVS